VVRVIGKKFRGVFRLKGGWKNSWKHRDRLCIMAEILEIAMNGALKTPIMYKTNLSFAQLNKYLPLLLEIGLLKNVNNGRKTVYKTTAKGLQYLQNHMKITTLLEMKSLS